MKEILCFTTSVSKGGAERQLSILANMLVEKGYNVKFATFSGDIDEYYIDSRVKRVRINQIGNSIKRFLEIYKFFSNVNIDCIISFGARCNFLVLLPLYFRKKIKIIVGERCATFDKMTWYKKLNYKLLYKRANYIVPNNYTQKIEIENSYPYLIKKTHVITNYTDLNKFVVTIPPLNETIRIGIFCRYDKQKNYERFAETIKILKNEVGDMFHVDWYGNRDILNGINPDFISFSQLIYKYNIGEVITLNGHTDNVADLIPQFDVLCLPSIGEGFSNSISEYICCGKPVLCSDVADNSIMVRDGINGFLFNPFDPKAMAQAFKRFFYLSSEEKTIMGMESRRIAESLFNKDKFINSYISLIEE